MSALHRLRLGVSRRDIGAGLVAGAAALLASALFYASLVARVALEAPASAWSAVQWDPLTVASLVVVPPIAVLVGTVVWRAVVPDEPAPRRGAVAGVLTAFGSLFGLGLAFGVVAGLDALSTAPLEAFGEFATTALVVFGSVLTATIIAPVGALVGYGYEWYLARRH